MRERAPSLAFHAGHGSQILLFRVKHPELGVGCRFLCLSPLAWRVHALWGAVCGQALQRLSLAKFYVSLLYNADVLPYRSTITAHYHATITGNPGLPPSSMRVYLSIHG